jgi:hypothetical protein
MEYSLLGEFTSSKMRENYFGILGYSVCGFVEGFIHRAVVIDINKGWPIFRTLKPSFERKKGSARYETESFALLTDAQFFTGNSVQIFQVKDSKTPLFVTAYAETPISFEEIGRRGLLTLNGLTDYFGSTLIP